MKISAGILLFKREKEEIFYFLVHPGGPFWKNKDAGAWSIPKGEVYEGESFIERALTEFQEETGKTVFAWALEGDIEMSGLQSNTVFIDWPPKSGKKIEIPEVDRWEWLSSEEAKNKINPAQIEFITEIEELLRFK